MNATRKIAVTRRIDAPASVIFDLLADPTKHSLIDGTGTVHASLRGPARLFLGAKFSMNMRSGFRYHTTNKVVVFEENRAIAWHHAAKFIWRYDLCEQEGATDVTESFDYSAPWGVLLIPLGFPQRNRVGIEKSLERLSNLVTS